jgi:hypothetical protein
MAALIPSASATGSGTMTLAGPSTNSNQTVTIPDTTGTMMVSGNMPAVSAVASSNQSFSAGVSTKVLFQTEVFDTNNCFASSTFTPTVAGYYLITSSLSMLANSSNEVSFRLFKNGSEVTRLGRTPGNSLYGLYINGSYLIYLNGTTDYVEIYCFTQAAMTTESAYVYFNGSLIRGA